MTMWVPWVNQILTHLRSRPGRRQPAPGRLMVMRRLTKPRPRRRPRHPVGPLRVHHAHGILVGMGAGEGPLATGVSVNGWMPKPGENCRMLSGSSRTRLAGPLKASLIDGCCAGAGFSVLRASLEQAVDRRGVVRGRRSHHGVVSLIWVGVSGCYQQDDLVSVESDYFDGVDRLSCTPTCKPPSPIPIATYGPNSTHYPAQRSARPPARSSPGLARAVRSKKQLTPRRLRAELEAGDVDVAGSRGPAGPHQAVTNFRLLARLTEAADDDEADPRTIRPSWFYHRPG
jgi:hypothetical protein